MRAGVVAADLVLAVDAQIVDTHAEQRTATGPSLALFAVTGLDAVIRQLIMELHRAAEALTTLHFVSHVFNPNLEAAACHNGSFRILILKKRRTTCPRKRPQAWRVRCNGPYPSEEMPPEGGGALPRAPGFLMLSGVTSNHRHNAAIKPITRAEIPPAIELPIDLFLGPIRLPPQDRCILRIWILYRSIQPMPTTLRLSGWGHATS